MKDQETADELETQAIKIYGKCECKSPKPSPMDDNACDGCNKYISNGKLQAVTEKIQRVCPELMNARIISYGPITKQDFEKMSPIHLEHVLRAIFQKEENVSMDRTTDGKLFICVAYYQPLYTGKNETVFDLTKPPLEQPEVVSFLHKILCK